MHRWLASIWNSRDPLFYTVSSRDLGRKVGMISILNIVPEMGRAELGHIWYSPLAQKTMVNTETTFLLLRYLFDELGPRHIRAHRRGGVIEAAVHGQVRADPANGRQCGQAAEGRAGRTHLDHRHRVEAPGDRGARAADGRLAAARNRLLHLKNEIVRLGISHLPRGGRRHFRRERRWRSDVGQCRAGQVQRTGESYSGNHRGHTKRRNHLLPHLCVLGTGCSSLLVRGAPGLPRPHHGFAAPLVLLLTTQPVNGVCTTTIVIDVDRSSDPICF
jgi:hypothetical protein